MASCFWTEDGHRRDPDAREIADRRSLAVEIVLHGLFPNADRGLAFERIEGETAVSEDELPERNHILDAIATVVTEQGFEQATVEKIAERAGMSKSSLYFHFRNRAEMMASMLLPERARLIELVESRVARYADFGSRLYAFMVVTAGYAARSHSILTALDWMRFHRIRVHLDDTPQQGPIHPFIAERVNGAAFPYPGLSELETVAYLHHLVIRPVLDRYVQNRHRDDTDEEGSIPETVVRSTRLLYPLVVGGLMEKEREG
jgi:AcrR family transcriptional regulator